MFLGGSRFYGWDKICTLLSSSRCSLSTFKDWRNLYVYIVNDLVGFKEISIFGVYLVYKL
jgi:hypothetical protein